MKKENSFVESKQMTGTEQTNEVVLILTKG